jgi:spore germination protein GerM
MLPAPVQPVQPPLPPALQERSLYFTQIDRAGIIFRSRVNRSLPVSDTPMTDVLRELMEGPNEDEQRRGLFTLIPPGTQILSATVQHGTAHINFNENFRYNTYGVEGYIGQLRQIIYTVTEFPAVTDVQILIEGRPVDFLGEGIWIGGPIRRGQF